MNRSGALRLVLAGAGLDKQPFLSECCRTALSHDKMECNCNKAAAKWPTACIQTAGTVNTLIVDASRRPVSAMPNKLELYLKAICYGACCLVLQILRAATWTRKHPFSAVLDTGTPSAQSSSRKRDAYSTALHTHTHNTRMRVLEMCMAMTVVGQVQVSMQGRMMPNK